MIPPPKTNKPQLNPREVLQWGGARAIAEALESTGYRIQGHLLSDYEQVLRSGKVWMIEGEPGAGKSAVAYATQHGFNMTMFPVQGSREGAQSSTGQGLDAVEQRLRDDDAAPPASVGPGHRKARAVNDAVGASHTQWYAFERGPAHVRPSVEGGEQLERRPAALLVIPGLLFELGDVTRAGRGRE